MKRAEKRTAGSAYPIPDLLASCPWIDLQLSSYRESEEPGQRLGPRTTNQTLESLTFPDASFDVVITSDVMEHVRLEDAAHREIRRVLRPGGIYLFTVPHFRTRPTLDRVRIVDPDDPSRDVDLLEREYHGDANSPDGRALAYRAFGTDLDEKLAGLGFSVAYTKEDFPQSGILNTELFFCRLVSRPKESPTAQRVPAEAVGVVAASTGASTRTEVAILRPSFSSQRTATWSPGESPGPWMRVAFVRTSVVSTPVAPRTANVPACPSTRVIVPASELPWLLAFSGAAAPRATPAERAAAKSRSNGSLRIQGYPSPADVNGT